MQDIFQRGDLVQRKSGRDHELSVKKYGVVNYVTETHADVLWHDPKTNVFHSGKIKIKALKEAKIPEEDRHNILSLWENSFERQSATSRNGQS